MATTSTQSNYSSSCLAPPRTWNYDVFLSFRGEDTRKNFTDHLYDALTRAGIRTFRDDNQLPRGKHIPFQLMKAIEESRISIIVFSKNYASSSWCLDEMVKVLECKNTRGQLVLPVFYDVDPSHVRKQTGKFAEAFAGYEEKKKVEGFGCEIKKRKHKGSLEKALGYGREIKKCKRTGSFEKAGTEAIEGISLVLPMTEETKISSTSFARINSLRLLKMHNVHVTGSLEHLSNQLRWLCWYHYPLKCLQSIFHMEKLVVLDMQYSKLNTIWKGSKVDTEHAGLPGPIRNKNISSPLFDIPATTEKKRTCYILFDIPSITEKKDDVDLTVVAAYEAKTDGSVSTRISKELDPHNASRYQCRRSCLSHFKTRNRGNYDLKSRITLEKEIVGGERIEVCFEIAPSACIVVKICELQLSYRTCTGYISQVNIYGRKIGFDLVETSSGLADKDNDSKSSSIIWEDVNNEEDEEDNECLHFYSMLGDKNSSSELEGKKDLYSSSSSSPKFLIGTRRDEGKICTDDEIR
ncbi:hypothetical protein LguiB_013736 [Lonicera macranthoides]